METGSLPWYAIQVRVRYEKSVALSLRQKGYAEFLPLFHELRQWSDRIKDQEFPLFPGYVFCRFDSHHCLPILTTPGVIQLVGAGGTLIPVDDREISDIQTVVLAHLCLRPTGYIEVGERVQIVAGPLKGIQGILCSVNKDLRLTLSISLLQRSVSVTVERGWIRSLEARPRLPGMVKMADYSRELRTA